MKKSPSSRSVELSTNRTYQALRCLGAPMQKRFALFLQSPYCNRSKTMSKLGLAFLDSIARGNEQFDKNAIWAAVFSDEPYKDVNFRKACSDLLKMMERFMAYEILESDEEQSHVNTLKFVVNQKLTPISSSVFNDLREKKIENKYHSSEFFKTQYDIERMFYLYMNYDQKLSEKSNVEDISHHLDQFYWIEKLKLYIVVLSHRQMGNFDYKLQFAEELLLFLRQYPVEESPALAIYYYSFLTMYEPDITAHYFNLKRLLEINVSYIPQKEAIEFFDSAMNYCTGKLNRGDRIFLDEYFDLFEKALNANVYIVGGEIAVWRFNNVVGISLRMGKFDWAENFIEKYKPYLPKNTRENTYSFNMARVYRFQGKFDKVLDLLQSVEYEDFAYNIISKVTLLVTYYELKSFDPLDSFLESFRVFLNRNKQMPAQPKKAHLNLIKYVRRLIRLIPGDKKAIAKLREEITQDRANTINHEWLLEKLSEL